VVCLPPFCILVGLDFLFLRKGYQPKGKKPKQPEEKTRRYIAKGKEWDALVCVSESASLILVLESETRIILACAVCTFSLGASKLDIQFLRVYLIYLNQLREMLNSLTRQQLNNLVIDIDSCN
jgi:hypothetical protein